MEHIDVIELYRRMSAGTATVVDVRTDDELALAAIDGARHIPMHELPERLGELNPSGHIAVLCHHGIRSESAAAFLETRGFSSVSSVDGGIDAWSLHVDPNVPRY